MSRLTPLGLMILALLREGPMHPYEMMRLMRIRRDERLVSLTNGTFYHTVSRLEERGLIAEVGVDREGRRPERTTYALEDSGRAAVSEWVRAELASAERADDFRVALAEAHNLDVGEVRELLQIRRDALAVKDADLAAQEDRVRAEGIPEQYRVELDHDQALLAAELAWLDGFLRRLAAGDIPWGPDVVAPTQTYHAQREAARQ